MFPAPVARCCKNFHAKVAQEFWAPLNHARLLGQIQQPGLSTMFVGVISLLSFWFNDRKRRQRSNQPIPVLGEPVKLPNHSGHLPTARSFNQNCWSRVQTLQTGTGRNRLSTICSKRELPDNLTNFLKKSPLVSAFTNVLCNLLSGFGSKRRKAHGACCETRNHLLCCFSNWMVPIYFVSLPIYYDPDDPILLCPRTFPRKEESKISPHHDLLNLPARMCLPRGRSETERKDLFIWFVWNKIYTFFPFIQESDWLSTFNLHL